jgi:hypothetical protein
MSATVVDVRCRGTVVALALLTSVAGCSDMVGAFGTGGSGGGAGSAGGAGGTTGTGGGNGGNVGTTNPLTQDVIDGFVAAHNAARSGPLNPTPSPALPPVSWDAILADSVYNYAIRCVGSSGLLNHNANRSADYQMLGAAATSAKTSSARARARSPPTTPSACG